MDLLTGTILLGGLLGAGGSGDKEKTQTREPWKPAQPFLLSNLQKNADMQKYYEHNPFNQQQRTSLDNIFSDLDTFRGATAPNLMMFANNAMTGGYKRPQFSSPGRAGYSPNRSSFGPNSGGPGGGMGGAFGSINGSNYGKQDWQSNNLMAYLDAAEQARAEAALAAQSLQNPMLPPGFSPGTSYGDINNERD